MTKHIVEYTAKNFTDLKWLKFVLKAVSTDGARHRLQFVKVDRRPVEGQPSYTMTSTDGFRIHRAIISDLPLTMAEDALPAGLYEIVIKPGMIVFTEAVDLTFPDVDAILKPVTEYTDHSAGKFGINPAFLADLEVKDALVMLTCNNERKPVYVQFYEGNNLLPAEAVIMPCAMPE